MRARISSGIRGDFSAGLIALTLSVGLRVGQESGGEESERSSRPAEVVIRVDMAKGLRICQASRVKLSVWWVTGVYQGVEPVS